MTYPYYVWTENNDPAWVDRYDGPDMMLVPGLPLVTARAMCMRLRLVSPDMKLWITDARGNTVDTFETRGPLVSSAQENKQG